MEENKLITKTSDLEKKIQNEFIIKGLGRKCVRERERERDTERGRGRETRRETWREREREPSLSKARKWELRIEMKNFPEN